MDKYNEALERAKKWEREHPHGYVIKDMMEYIFPELRESEDERIRKHLIAIVELYWGKTNDPDKAKDLAYLEKQKESLHISETYKENADSFTDEDERIRKEIINFLRSPFVNENITDEKVAPWLAWLEKQREPHYTKRNALFDKCVAECDPAVMKEVSDEIDEMLEKEQKPVYIEGYGDTATVYSDGSISCKQKQKPASTEDMPYITDEHFFEREPVDSFRYKLAKYMTQNSRKEESPDGYTYHISAETILEMAKEELLKRGVVQKPVKWRPYDKEVLTKIKELIDSHFSEHGQREVYKDWLDEHISQPVEWSKEDEDMRLEAIRVLVSGCERYRKESGCLPGWHKVISWLKFLRPVKQEWDTHDKAIVNCIVCCLDGQFVPEAARKQALKWFNKHRRDFLNSPSWKPNEEQMEELNKVRTLNPGLDALYQQLKNM